MKLTGLKKRIEALDGPQRGAIADQLITVAGADGVITPGEVATLTKIFTSLGLDSAEIPASSAGVSTPSGSLGSPP